MPIATCIKTFRGGHKSLFEEGNEYEYSKHEPGNGKVMYSITSERKDYITMFHSDESDAVPTFSYYFCDKKSLREKKIKDLLAGDK